MRKNNRKLKDLGTESDESDASISSGSEHDERPTEEQGDDMFGESFEKKRILNQKDIDGQEWNQVEEEQEIFEPFNLDKEMEQGHFDESGYYIRKKDQMESHDTWLQGITKQDMEKARAAQIKQSVKAETIQEGKDAEQLWIQVLKLLKPKETLTSALKRYGGKKVPAWKKGKHKQVCGVLFTFRMRFREMWRKLIN